MSLALTPEPNNCTPSDSRGSEERGLAMKWGGNTLQFSAKEPPNLT